MSGFHGTCGRHANGCHLDALGTLRQQHAVLQPKGLVADAQHTRIVRGDYNAAAVACELSQALEQQPVGAGIESSAGLVEQQIRCLECKHIGNGDTALLSARMGKGACVADSGEIKPDAGERCANASLDLGFVQSKIAGAKRHLVKDRGGKKLLLRALLHECHGFAVRTKFIRRGVCAKRGAVRHDRPRLHGKRSGKDTQQR